jgi:hypothetical protein
VKVADPLNKTSASTFVAAAVPLPVIVSGSVLLPLPRLIGVGRVSDRHRQAWLQCPVNRDCGRGGVIGVGLGFGGGRAVRAGVATGSPKRKLDATTVPFQASS